MMSLSAGSTPCGRPMVTSPYDQLARFYDLVTGADGVDLEMYDAFARRLALPVLEMGVGTGRVALALARNGYAVWGIDQSAGMLAIARQRAAAEALTVQLLEADAGTVRLEQQFGLVFWAADGFLHLNDTAEQLQALQTAAQHLAPDGRLVLDLPAPVGTWADWEAGVRPLELIWHGIGPSGRPLQYFASTTVDASLQTRHVTHLFDELDETGRVQRTAVSFDLRFVFPAEARLLVQTAGLILDDLYGGYDLEPFTGGSERMIMVARPAA